MEVPVPPRATESTPAQAKFKVLELIVPCMFVSLETKPTNVVPRVEEFVPPFATGNIPETSAVKDTVPLYKAPAEVERTTPEIKEEIVVDPPPSTLNNVVPVEEATAKTELVEVVATA